MINCPLISVIIPVYNEENNIARCVDSLLKQNYSSFELLLIDDGSQDKSGMIIDEYAARYSFIRAYHKPNGGVSSARNLGLKEAHGEWVTFCDADDYVTPDWLRLFAIQINERIALIVQPFIQKESEINDEPVKEGKVFEGNAFAFLENYFETPMVGSLCNKLCSLSLIRKYQLWFNESFRFCEDTDFLVHYLNIMNNDVSIVHTQSGGYCYSVINFSSKYNYVETYFETLLSIFLKMRDMHQNSFIPKAYGHILKYLTHALWDLFLRNKKKAWKALRIYHKEVGDAILEIHGFPLAFKLVLCLPPFFSFLCLKVMGILLHLTHK